MASPRLLVIASTSVSNRRIWIVQDTLISSQSARARSTLKPASVPSGSAKLGSTEYLIDLNGAPQSVEELNNFPVRMQNGAVLLLKDVAHVRDGFGPQTNIVRANGQRGVLMAVYKTGNASTLDIVSRVKNTVAHAAESLPPELKVTALFDQSIFVRAAVQGVEHRVSGQEDVPVDALALQVVDGDAGGGEEQVGVGVGRDAVLLLGQLAAILAVGRLFGIGARRFGQPTVIAEILAGSCSASAPVGSSATTTSTATSSAPRPSGCAPCAATSRSSRTASRS